MRVLILGPVNTPHTEHLALGAAERGFDVTVGGDEWRDAPQTSLAESGIEVSAQAWPTARWLRELVARVQPDVVHANWFKNAFVYLLYGAAPMVAMAWGSDVYRAGRLERLQNRFVARRAGMVMADSEDLLERLLELGAARDRAAVLNWGIDLEEFSPAERPRSEIRAELGLPDGRIMLSPRALRDVYNPRTIIDAFELLAERDPELQLILKHAHSDEPDLGPLRYPDRVHFVGHVPYDRMADYFRAADVCVSVPSSDSSPRSVWEAMGCGCPCVVSDLPWAHELIEDGRDAAIVPIDRDAVARAIEGILTDRAHAARLADSARVLVERHRNRELELDRLAAVYQRVASERHGATAGYRPVYAATAAAGEAVARARRRVFTG